MTKQEIIDKYGALPEDIKILEILIKTPLKTIGKLIKTVKEQEVNATDRQ